MYVPRWTYTPKSCTIQPLEAMEVFNTHLPSYVTGVVEETHTLIIHAAWLLSSPLACFCPVPTSMLCHSGQIQIWGSEALRTIPKREVWTRMTRLGSLHPSQFSKTVLAAFVPQTRQLIKLKACNPNFIFMLQKHHFGKLQCTFVLLWPFWARACTMTIIC